MRVVLDYWFCGCLEQSQSAAQDIGLELRVVGNAQRSSKRERYPEGPRRIDDFSVLADQTDPGGGDAVLFEEVREGTDGTRAGWSNGCQHRAMHTGVMQTLRQVGGCILHQGRIGVRAQDRVVILRHCPDFSRVSQLSKPINR